MACKWPLLVPWIWMVSSLKEVHPERKSDFPATSAGASRQMLQVMELSCSEYTSQGNPSFHVGMNFLFCVGAHCGDAGFLMPWPFSLSSNSACSEVLLWDGLLGRVWEVLSDFFWNARRVGCVFGFMLICLFTVVLEWLTVWLSLCSVVQNDLGQNRIQGDCNLWSWIIPFSLR